MLGREERRMRALRACPFCGGEPVTPMWDIQDGSINGIYCSNCKALVKFPIQMKGKETYGKNFDKWAKKYNRRAYEE